MRYSRKACSLEFNNAHSRDSIVVESREGVTIAHVPDGLERKINPLMQDGRENSRRCEVHSRGNLGAERGGGRNPVQDIWTDKVQNIY